MRRSKFINRFLSYKNDYASLTIVGVGPGDPSLLTIAALKAIRKAKVIAYPISNDDKKSFSAEIVKDFIKFKKKIPIIFPMARKEFNSNEIWNNASEMIVKFLKNNESVVLLCLGDTSLFASSSYILRIINNCYPEITTKIVPGISSLSAAAAFSNFDLVKKGETLIIQECPSVKSELLDLLNRNKENRSVLALMKVGKRWPWVKDVLMEEDLLNNSLLALNVGMFDQVIEKVSKCENEMIPYLSLLLIRLTNL